ncbi:MAG: hypothetical protein Q9M89_10145 [Persephonella sp.]|nr:hypothetical protein [Persephonella sp.]
MKAFYQGFTINIPPKLIEIRGNYGKPAEIFLHSDDLQIKSLLKRMKYTLSISHEKKLFCSYCNYLSSLDAVKRLHLYLRISDHTVIPRHF